MARLKAEITAFEQKESKSLYEAWERFKGSLKKCPQHGIEAWEKARIFFQGMASNTRTLVNAATGGSLKTKTPEEALELLESLASQEFDNAPAPVAPRRGGIMKLEEAHATEDCDYMRTTEKPLAEVNTLWYDQKNQNQHPGLSHKSNHQLNPPLPVQPDTPQQSANAFREDTYAFMQETRSTHQNQEASIRNLEIQIGQLSKQFSERAPGTFPSNTVVNPREHCNAITTRSGTVIQHIEEQPEEKKKDGEETDEEKKEEKQNDTIEVDKSIPEKAKKKLFKWEKKKAIERQNKPLDLSPYARIPYPQRLKKEIQKQQFMKDLLSRKRKLQECETVILTKECNVIIQKKLPTKVKDPGSFSIPCTIGKMEVDNVLCDLGASINVMPLYIMKKLGITEVKPTKTTVQLADRSSKQAYGIIEDILVKVDKFIIPVDFVILDIEEDVAIPMIFGRPFLATSGALIDVLKGELIIRVDREQETFKFFDKEVPSSVAQPEDQVKKREQTTRESN
ncbi:uncharacterized protein LOC133295722 [Gastrolobium bilobum]|uniref:uncharacterized protein LOC133295722 n=1 Tax=Gastrolobium bilobum TaxID=150636 RepID=UPI002AB161F3|nr:uncharacterized protein LOC133295722 [Gastrolobium bilobum]